MPRRARNSHPRRNAAPLTFATLWKAFLIVASGLLVYAPAVHGEWLWDDDEAIPLNPDLKDPWGWLTVWSGASPSADYFPLTATVRWIQWQVFHEAVAGYHLCNIALHLASALLIWRVFWKLGIGLPWLGGLIFAIHPIFVESVAWISELKNTLSLPLLLLSFLAWLDFGNSRKGVAYAVSLGCFLLAVAAKSSVVTFPLILLLHTWWKTAKITRRNLVEVLPFLLVSVAFGLFTIHFQFQRAIGDEPLPAGDFVDRTLIAGLAVAFYLWKTILPIHLLPMYPQWIADRTDVLLWLPWPLLVAGFLWAWRHRASWGRHVIFGFGVFLISLAPVLGFIDMAYMRISWTADHFLYLPNLGLLGLAVAGVNRVLTPPSPPAMRKAGVGAIILVVALWMGTAFRHAGRFVDEETLWTYTLSQNPDAWQAHTRLAMALIKRGDAEAVRVHFAEAQRLRPDLAQTATNYANILEDTGDIDGAIVMRRMAVELSPEFPFCRFMLARTLAQSGRLDEARMELETLVRMRPDDANNLVNLGQVLHALDRNTDALRRFNEALEIDPSLADARTQRDILEAELANDAPINLWNAPAGITDPMDDR
jgi:Flp pilus assembly protein TadD, contains TPR repeats